MKPLSYICPLAILLLMGCSDKNTSQTATSPAPATASNTPGNNPLNAPADYLGGLAKGQKKAVATVDVAALNQAIQMFNVEHDRFPRDLDELVTTKTIPKIPDAPYGMKLSYDPAAGTVKVVPAQ